MACLPVSLSLRWWWWRQQLLLSCLTLRMLFLLKLIRRLLRGAVVVPTPKPRHKTQNSSHSQPTRPSFFAPSFSSLSRLSFSRALPLALAYTDTHTNYSRFHKQKLRSLSRSLSHSLFDFHASLILTLTRAHEQLKNSSVSNKVTRSLLREISARAT